jgi:hypothetical protein
MEFKSVKNVNRPGRPPSKSVWAKDADGNFIRNEAGQFGYRPATAEDLANKKNRVSKKAGKKKGAPRAPKADVILDKGLKKLLLSKKTYKILSATELLKIKDIVGGMVDSAKESEKSALARQVAKLQAQLANLG